MATTITDEQFAARELVRDWAAGSGATAAVRDIEQGEPKAWQPVFAGLQRLDGDALGCCVDEQPAVAGRQQQQTVGDAAEHERHSARGLRSRRVEFHITA